MKWKFLKLTKKYGSFCVTGSRVNEYNWLWFLIINFWLLMHILPAKPARQLLNLQLIVKTNLLHNDKWLFRCLFSSEIFDLLV